MQAKLWLLPALVLTSLQRSVYSEPSGPIRTDRFNADQLALLYQNKIFPVDESETTLALKGESDPESITLICLAGVEINRAHNLLEGRLTLKREQEARLHYRDQFGGLWTATVDPLKGTISLRPKKARGYQYEVNGRGSSLDLEALVDFKVLQKILANGPKQINPAAFAATHDELPGNIVRTAEELTTPVKP